LVLLQQHAQELQMCMQLQQHLLHLPGVALDKQPTVPGSPLSPLPPAAAAAAA
jgi:hypothetical protein